MAFSIATGGEALHSGRSKNINKVQRLHAFRGLAPQLYPVHQQLFLRNARHLRQGRLASSQDSDPSVPPSRGMKGALPSGDPAASTNGEESSQMARSDANQNDQDPTAVASMTEGTVGGNQEFSTIGDVVLNGPLAGSVSREEAAFAAALQQDNEQRASRASQANPASPQLSAFPPRPIPGGPPRATLERLAKARQYREAAEQRFRQSSSSGETASPVTGGLRQPAEPLSPSQAGASPPLPAPLAASQANSALASVPPLAASTTASTGAAQSIGDPAAPGDTDNAVEPPQPGPGSSSRLVGGTADKAAQFLSKVRMQCPTRRVSKLPCKAHLGRVLRRDNQMDADPIDSWHLFVNEGVLSGPSFSIN
jgi:hypothetical protein